MPIVNPKQLALSHRPAVTLTDARGARAFMSIPERIFVLKLRGDVLPDTFGISDARPTWPWNRFYAAVYFDNLHIDEGASDSRTMVLTATGPDGYVKLVVENISDELKQRSTWALLDHKINVTFGRRRGTARSLGDFYVQRVAPAVQPHPISKQGPSCPPPLHGDGLRRRVVAS